LDSRLRAPSVTPSTLRAFARLLGGIAAVPTVRRVSLAADDPAIDLWVLLRDADPADEERSFLLERDFFATGAELPLEIYVVPPAKVDERNLPSAETFLER
jgi:hypothetical protein